MKDLFEKIQSKVNKVAGRIMWATLWRKDRESREEAYLNLSRGYEQMLIRMWERVGPPNTKAPRMAVDFSKSSGTSMLVFRQMALDRFSHFWVLGETDRKKGARLYDMNTEEYIPYYISDEIIAATAIASILSENETAEEEEVNDVLARYYEWQKFSPLEISNVWMSRLNTMVCNFWRMSPVMGRTMELKEQKGIDFSIAHKLAMEEVEPLELPVCMNSDNQDGRINMSYEDSCFYTIDHHGIAVCREFPNEFLDLSDYEVMRTVAATIYRDITGNQDLDDIGVSGASWLLQKEPEWMNGNLFPHERQKVA